MKKSLMLIIFITLHSFAQEQQFIISSGSKGGNYHKTGNLLTKYLNKENTRANFINVNSTGSIENFKNLDDYFSDFALVQRNILLQTIYNKTTGTKDVEVVLPLFQEKLLIYCKKDIKTFSFNNFIKAIENGKIKSLGFTSTESYSFKIYKKIAKLFNFPENKVNLIFNNYEDLILDFNNNNLDALATFSLEIQELEKDKKVKKIYFNNSQIKLITNRINNISSVKLSKEKYSIGTYTFLIGLTKKINEFNAINNRSITTILSSSIKKDTTFLGVTIANTIRDFKSSTKSISLDGIPVTSSLSKQLNLQTNYFQILILVLVTLLLLILILMKINFFNYNRLKMFWVKNNHIFLGLLLLFILYYTCTSIMIWAEKDLFNSLKIKSQILNMSLSDLHLWVVVSNLSSDNNGILPLSTIGKLMFSVSFYSIWLGGICIFIVDYFKTQTFKKRKNGMKKVTFKNHIILSGWNGSTEKFVTDFTQNIENYIKQKPKIVCVVEDVQEIQKQYSKIKELHDLHKIEMVQGNLKQEDILKQVNIQYANTVVLFSKDSTCFSDENTLLKALSISRYCRAKTLQNKKKEVQKKGFDLYKVDKYIDSIYIIAEINNDKYKEDLLAADVNEVICSANYSSNVIAQSIINHGLSRVFDEILTFNKENEFYTISLDKEQNKIFVGKTFDELLIMLRKVNIQLIGVKVIFHDVYGNEIIDRNEIKKLITEEGIESDIIINPISKNEVNRKVDDDDKLIVFSRSEKDLEKNVQLLYS